MPAGAAATNGNGRTHGAHVSGSNGSAPLGCRVVIGYRNGSGAADITLPDTWRVRVDDALMAELPGAGVQAKVTVLY